MGSSLDEASLDTRPRRPGRRRGRSTDKRGTAAYRDRSRVLTRRAAALAAERVDRETTVAKLQIETTINGEPADFPVRSARTLLSGPHWPRSHRTKEGCATGDCGACSILLEGRLVPRAWCSAPEAQGRHDAIEGCRVATPCIRCSRNSWSMPRFNAASARRGSSSPPRRCSTRSRTRLRQRSGTGSPATCAAAPDTTRSSARCSTPRQR